MTYNTHKCIKVYKYYFKYSKQGDNMIIDITGVRLTLGNFGKDCLGNGNCYDEKGKSIECCCDECDYLICCLESHNPEQCNFCKDKDCPNNKSEN